MNHTTQEREDIRANDNPIGMDGIEFIEYATSKPQALGQVLEMMGFRPIARHRSREVMLYRQGEVNIIVNAHHAAHSQSAAPDEQPVIAAMALRVRDAGVAYQRALDLGAWAVPTRVEVMELNIPAIHGVGQSPSVRMAAVRTVAPARSIKVISCSPVQRGFISPKKACASMRSK